MSGNWTKYVSENRCLGTQCHADEQCAFDHTKKLFCSNATCQTFGCNASYIYAYYNDSSETILDFTVAQVRCAGIPCGEDKWCFSGKCFNGSCLSSFQSKPDCAPAPQTFVFDELAKTTTSQPATSRCEDVHCQTNSSCASKKCYFSSCLSEEQVYPTCNTTFYYSIFNDTTQNVTHTVSFNRCLNTMCDQDNQC